MIVVDEADGTGVVGEVPANGGGDVGEATPVAAVEEGVVRFAPGEGFVFVEEAIESLPALAVGLERGKVLGIEGGLRHDLSPVNTSQVSGVFGGDEPVGGEDVEPAVVIQIGKGGTPAPACHGGAGFQTDIVKAAFAIGCEEGVAPGHALEGGEGFLVRAGLELFLVGDAISGAGEHVADVEVHPAIAIKVSPVGGHAGGGILDLKLGGNVDEEGEFAVGGALVLVEAVAAKVVCDVEVEVSILIVVLPRGGKGEAGVVLIETGPGGDVLKSPITHVFPEDIGSSVVGVVEGDGFA